jgi:hypothetical protein
MTQTADPDKCPNPTPELKESCAKTCKYPFCQYDPEDDDDGN